MKKKEFMRMHGLTRDGYVLLHRDHFVTQCDDIKDVEDELVSDCNDTMEIMIAAGASMSDVTAQSDHSEHNVIKNMLVTNNYRIIDLSKSKMDEEVADYVFDEDKVQ